MPKRGKVIIAWNRMNPVAVVFVFRPIPGCQINVALRQRDFLILPFDFLLVDNVLRLKIVKEHVKTDKNECKNGRLCDC